MDMYGYSFTPDASSRARQAFNGSGGLPAGANEALRVLSMHLPASLGGHPIAPEDLLRPALPGAGDANRAFGGPVASQPMPSAPTPNATAGPAASQPFGGMGGASSPLGNLTENAMAPPPPGGNPTFGFGGGGSPLPNPVQANPASAPPGVGGSGPGFLQLLNTLFGGQDFGAPPSGGGRFL